LASGGTLHPGIGAIHQLVRQERLRGVHGRTEQRAQCRQLITATGPHVGHGVAVRDQQCAAGGRAQGTLVSVRWMIPPPWTLPSLVPVPVPRATPGSPVGLRLGATAVRRVRRELRVALGVEPASARLLVGRLRLFQAGGPVLLRSPAVAVSALLLVVLLCLGRFFRGPCSQARCCGQRCDGGNMDERVHVALPKD